MIKIKSGWIDAKTQFAVIVEYSDGTREVMLRAFTPKHILKKEKKISDKNI